MRGRIVKLLKPDFVQVVLNLEHGLIGENLGNKLSIVSHLVIRGGVGRNFCQEFAEIVSDWQVDEDLLVKTGIIVTINGLNILKFREVT